MRTSQPRITIGMPVYNGEAFLRESLESLLAQRYTDYRLIVSDNASTDATEEIAREYARHDSRVEYHRLPKNIGAIGNFNHVFSFCRTEFFKWAASDDICEPAYLESCVGLLDEHRSAVWCHSQSGKIDERGRVLSRDDPDAQGWAHSTHAGLPRTDCQSESRHRRFRGVLLGTSWCADSYGLIRAGALRKTKLYPACFGSERVLIGALSLQGRYEEVPQTLFYQRVHPAAAGSISTAADQQTYMDTAGSTQFATARLRLLKGHLDAVCMTPMAVGERLRCLFVIVQYLLQVRQWKRIAAEMLTGHGLGQLRDRVVTVSKR